MTSEAEVRNCYMLSTPTSGTGLPFPSAVENCLNFSTLKLVASSLAMTPHIWTQDLTKTIDHACYRVVFSITTTAEVIGESLFDAWIAASDAHIRECLVNKSGMICTSFSIGMLSSPISKKKNEVAVISNCIPIRKSVMDDGRELILFLGYMIVTTKDDLIIGRRKIHKGRYFSCGFSERFARNKRIIKRKVNKEKMKSKNLDTTKAALGAVAVELYQSEFAFYVVEQFPAGLGELLQEHLDMEAAKCEKELFFYTESKQYDDLGNSDVTCWLLKHDFSIVQDSTHAWFPDPAGNRIELVHNKAAIYVTVVCNVLEVITCLRVANANTEVNNSSIWSTSLHYSRVFNLDASTTWEVIKAITVDPPFLQSGANPNPHWNCQPFKTWPKPHSR